MGEWINDTGPVPSLRICSGLPETLRKQTEFDKDYGECRNQADVRIRV